MIDEAVKGGASQLEACELLGLDSRTVQRWKKEGIRDDLRAGPRSSPPNKLTTRERKKILVTVNEPEYRDLSPKQIVPALADKGEYMGSESSIYRILREEGQLNHREKSRAPQKRNKPEEHVATGPNQVWSWDITYLRSPIRGEFFYLYMIEDVWSRKIVGWEVRPEESSVYASLLLQRTCVKEGVKREDLLVLHMDNGSPMKGSTFLATMQRLGVVPSFSRPRVSNDNPYSESLFKTLKYRPEYPGKPFESLEQASEWLELFVAWYNTEHRHSAIRFVTPEDRHSGKEKEILAKRTRLYEKARKRHPERWSRNVRNWEPIGTVRLNPKEQEVSVAKAS
jgi:transposase InsO family protein